MREVINYMMEANLALLVFLLVYYLLLKTETHFRLIRFLLLSAIVASLTFPLFHFGNSTGVPLPTIGNVIPDNWLPEVVISAAGNSAAPMVSGTQSPWWTRIAVIYFIGIALCTLGLTYQLCRLLRFTSAARTYRIDRLRVLESNDEYPTFSFFRIIHIGSAGSLSAAEKQQIIHHESVHARELHSLDMLLVTVLRIGFWFNPLLILYKKIFIQLHEFEADARAVTGSDVNNYCNLLARVALQSAHFPIASHFNQSLTIRRIEMIRAIKQRVRPWKLVVALAIIPLMFVAIACQDQLSELQESTVSQSGDLPPEVVAQQNAYIKQHPGARLTYMVGLPAEVDKLISSPDVSSRVVSTYSYTEEKKGVLLSDVAEHAESLKTDDDVYMIVEHQPEFPGGFVALAEFLGKNIQYPAKAAQNGEGGTVYVAMIIDEQGNVSDVKVMRGVSELLDAEAVRVVSLLPAWIPGKQNGKPVKVRFIMPIRFDPQFGSSDNSSSGAVIEPVENSNYAMRIQDMTKRVLPNGELNIRGRVVQENGNPLAGVNVIIAGTTTGTSTDPQGNFSLTSQLHTGELVFSFIGFDSRSVPFEN